MPAGCVQPLAGIQLSTVHTLLSSQSGAGPPTQIPPLQVSGPVQKEPSSHDAVLLGCVQPKPVSHSSSVQTLLSLQLGAGPPTQMPPLHASAVVQALPSLHIALLSTFAHPEVGLQLSSVQPLLSLQLTGLLAQA